MAERFAVAIVTKRLPGSFRGPKPLRSVLSSLSTGVSGVIGGVTGMPFDEAEKLAREEDVICYVDGEGHLRSSEGVIVKV